MRINDRTVTATSDEGFPVFEEDAQDTASLVSRFRAGDADAVGEFLLRYGSLVRAHYRRKIGRSMRRLVDSQDLLSTITRRLCQRVMANRILAVDSRQLWALVFRIGDDALIDRVRIVSRLRSLEADDSPFVQMLRDRLTSDESRHGQGFEEELSAMLECLATDIDRELLMLWLHGATLSDAGEALGLAPAATRKRWQRLREAIRKHWEGQGAM